MHDVAGTDDRTAVDLADTLVAQAHAEDRRGRPKALDQLQRHARFVGRARAGRDHDALGGERGDLIDAQRVVAHHLHFGAQRLQVLHEVVGEAVVVVDHPQHGQVPSLIRKMAYTFSV
ncbi:hypothetical protein D3C71_763030 [compost metagenome]